MELVVLEILDSVTFRDRRVYHDTWLVRLFVSQDPRLTVDQTKDLET